MSMNKEMDQIPKSINGNKVQNQSVSPEPDVHCGFFGMHFQSLKTFLDARWILVFISMAAFAQGFVVNGLLNVVISTIERRFNLSSIWSGIISVAYDIGSLVCVVPITYFGGRVGSSKPRYISAGLMIMGLGSLIFSLPHFISGPSWEGTNLQSPSSAEFHNSGSKVCLENSSSLQNKDSLFSDQHACNDNMVETEPSDVLDTVSLSNYKLFFLVGNFLHGCGASPLITLGLTFLEDNVLEKKLPFYIGTFQTLFVVGPAFGFIGGAQFLKIFTDFYLVSNKENHVNPNTWIGAWWIGFLISCLISWLCALVIAFYPPTVKKSIDNKQNGITTSNNDLNNVKEGLLGSLKYLITNLSFVCLCLAEVGNSTMIASLSLFMPKYFEVQLKISSSLAGMLVGGFLVSGGAIGTFLGGYLTKLFGFGRLRPIIMCIIAHVLIIPLAFGFILHCTTPKFAGVTSQLENNIESIGRFEAPCNNKCINCREVDFYPVCDISHGIVHFNPCFAGCKSKEINKNDRQYLNCSCGETILSSSTSGSGKIFETGLCQSECNLMFAISIFTFVIIFIIFLVQASGIVSTMRAVDSSYRSLALGIDSIVIRLLGSIPGPIISGFFIDKSCLLWKKVSSNECLTTPSKTYSNGSCLLYDNYLFSVNLVSFIVITQSLTVLFYLLSFWATKRRVLTDT